MRDSLKLFGAIPSAARVERDGNVISGGGVTAGIDFALALIAGTARRRHSPNDPTLLNTPGPPFTGGTPELAPPHIYARGTGADGGKPGAAQSVGGPDRPLAIGVYLPMRQSHKG